MIDVFDPRPPTSALVAGICHCSSPHEHASRAEAQAYSSARAEIERNKKEVDARVASLTSQLNAIRASSPDATRFEIEDAREVGPNLVVKARFPNCADCAYEGIKVLVYLNTKPLDAMKWKKLDPHFRAKPKTGWPAKEAPSPDARFPASPEGWQDAVAYATSRNIKVL